VVASNFDPHFRPGFANRVNVDRHMEQNHHAKLGKSTKISQRAASSSQTVTISPRGYIINIIKIHYIPLNTMKNTMKKTIKPPLNPIKPPLNILNDHS
jgi:hypothetical protein